MKLVLAILTIACISSCQHRSLVLEEIEEERSELKFGAIYISCESPAWEFNFADLFLCEQTESAPIELNPDHACPMSSIQREIGEVTINFTDDYSLGRMKIEVAENVFMEDESGNVVRTNYVDDNEVWYMSEHDVRLKLSIVNAYVGGCFHELLRWETMN